MKIVGNKVGLPKPHLIDMVDGSWIEIDIKDFHKKPSVRQMETFECLDLDEYYEGIKGYVFDEFDFDEDDYECDENSEEIDDYKMDCMIRKTLFLVKKYVMSELRKVK